MKWWDVLTLPWTLLPDLHRDVARVQWSQAEILTRLKEFKMPTTIVARPGDRYSAIAELWQIRDLLAESDPDQAAQLVSVYNELIARGTGPGTP